MNANPPRRDWFFAIEEAPVLVTATLTVPHTRQGIHSLKVVQPFAGMASQSGFSVASHLDSLSKSAVPGQVPSFSANASSTHSS